MDRGRVGYAASGNKFIRELIIKSRRHAHTQRIKKIMTRKPGTSNTLDNRPPHIIKALLTNPRKVALRQEFNVVTERENKFGFYFAFDLSFPITLHLGPC